MINQVFLYLSSQPILGTALYLHFQVMKGEARKGHQPAHSHMASNGKTRTQTALPNLLQLLEGGCMSPQRVGPMPSWDSEFTAEQTSGGWKLPLTVAPWTLGSSLSSLVHSAKVSRRPAQQKAGTQAWAKTRGRLQQKALEPHMRGPLLSWSLTLPYTRRHTKESVVTPLRTTSLPPRQCFPFNRCAGT